MGHRVLVTGGAGFIGSHVAQALLDRGHAVTVVDDLSGGTTDNVPAAATFVQASIVDSEAMNRLFVEGRITHVYHLAAYAAEGLSQFIKRFNYTNNVIGSVNLLNASINTGVRLFVFASSIAVYGSHAEPPMTEEVSPCPDDSYGIAKYAIELELRACHQMFGLDYVVFRPHNVFGPRQNVGDPYRNVVGILMNNILRGKPMTVFGDGSQTRAFTYIDDVAPIMASAIDVPAARNHIFNIGADQPHSLVGLANRVAAAMGVAPTIQYLPARVEVSHALAAHDKLRQVFDVPPSTPLDEGLAVMAEWVRSNGARASLPFDHIEVRKNLPQVWQRQ